MMILFYNVYIRRGFPGADYIAPAGVKTCDSDGKEVKVWIKMKC